MSGAASLSLSLAGLAAGGPSLSGELQFVDAAPVGDVSVTLVLAARRASLDLPERAAELSSSARRATLSLSERDATLYLPIRRARLE